jgi:very-short-patch-repair endonuclease
MAQGPAALPATGIDDFVKAAIQQYRAKLLDLSSRNPLVNFRHSDRSRSHIRVSDEIPEKLFERLESSRQLWLDPLPDPLLIPADEELPLFQEARRRAAKDDAEYKKALAELGPAPSERKRQKLERELRNRVRTQLGLEPYDPASDPKKRAAELGISTEYDLPKPNGSNRRRRFGYNIQTLFFRDDLDRKLSGLRESARSLLLDAGLSALFCAFGFLEYYESENSDEKRIAPLVFYPIELDRELENGEYRYFISGKNEDVEINVVLRELLKRQYAIELPEWSQEEGESNPLGVFLAKVEDLIRPRRDWRVRRYVTVGLFTFSTLVIYKDLDPEKWPQAAPLHKLPLLRTLIAGAEVHGSSFAPDYDVDQVSEADAMLITDADSSQHSAVIDVLKGKNTVIQGPPGTGKSQTITNIISAALNAGKSVLFVAEKMAALEVVKKRLDAAGLGPFCLELHSSKTSKTAVVESLSTRLSHQPRRPSLSVVTSNLEAIQKARTKLIYYVEKTNQPAGQTGLTVRDVLLGSAMRESAQKTLPDGVPTTRFPNALGLSGHVRKELADAAANLERQMAPLKTFGTLTDHPWRGLRNSELTDLEIDLLLDWFGKASVEINNLLGGCAAIEQQTGAKVPNNLKGLATFAKSVADLKSPAEGVDEQLFRCLVAAESRELLAQVISSVQSIFDTETQLASYVTDPARAVSRGSDAAQTALDQVSRLKAGDLSVGQLNAKLTELRARRESMKACERVGHETVEAFAISKPDFPYLKAVWTALRQLQKLPSDMWTSRYSCVLDESNRSVIKRAASTFAALRDRRALLEGSWDASLMPPVPDLKNYIVALRSTNWLTSLFNSHCRAARSLMKVAWVGANRTLARQTLAQEYSKWAQMKEDEHKFVNDLGVATAIGEPFKGLATDFVLLERICDWGAETRAALSKYGATGQSLCHQLFEVTAEQLRRYSRLTDDARFPELSKILFEADDSDTMTIEELVHGFDRECEEIESILASLSELTFSTRLPLSRLTTLLQLLHTIENQKSSVERQATKLDFLAAPEHNIQHIGQLKSTLEFAEVIADSNLPTLFKRWLHQDRRHLEVLKHQVASLVDRMSAVTRAVEKADKVARLDWQLWAQCSEASSADLGMIGERFTRATEQADQLQDYLNFLLAEDAASESGLGPVLSAFVSASEDYHDLVMAADFVFYRSAAEEVLNADPRLRRHSGSSHDQLRAQYQQLDKEFISLRRRLLAWKIAEHEVPDGVCQGRVADLTELALVQHVAGQVRPRLSLRDLCRRAGHAIKALKPCWMMSPMSVAQFLEPGSLHFDLVLMDEASQIRPEEALGAIARGGQVVVVGDQMQLPPTSFFQRLSEDGGGEDEEDLEDVHQESVLEAAAARFYPPRMLKWHYRSEHGSLISFSNHEFYRDDLTVFPSPYHDHDEYGVKLIQVDGVYGSGVNEQEARRVVEEAAKFMSAQPGQSLGIVAVNSRQAEVIRELIDQLCASEPDAEAYRAKWATELESLFVKNLENVQGDERDVIFVSTVYGRDASGNFYQRFGPINSVYGHRRLNVLFTRAKKKVVIFSSMKPEDIQDEGKSWGVRALKGYLQFARSGSWILPTAQQADCESEFEEWVLRALRANGYEAVPQLGFAGYRLDLAVRHPKHPGTFLCGIECDGATYHSARSVRERDRLRQEVLERLGWRIYRIWSTDWFRNPTLQTKNLIKYLKQLATDE